jgi:4-carboxymuconolactone decarboxylase
MSTLTNMLADIPLLAQHAPYTLAGYAEFRAVIEQDGALPARMKALFAAVAGVDRREPEIA